MSPSAQQERAAALRALFSVAVAIYVGTLIAGGRASGLTEGVTYLVVIIVSVVLHELAHAAVVLLVGGKLRGMRLGFGPRLTPATSTVDIRPLIIAGHVSYQPPPGVSKAKLFAIGVAGIVVHAVLVVVALLAGHGQWSVLRIDLLIANLGALFSNVIPAAGSLTTTAGGPNDGAQLIALLRQRGPSLSASDPDLQTALATYNEHGLPAMQQFVVGLNRRDNEEFRLALAQRLLAGGQWEAAATLASGIPLTLTSPWRVDNVYARAVALAALSGQLDPQAPVLVTAAASAERAVGGVPVGEAGQTRAQVTLTLAMIRVVQGRFDEATTLATWCLPGMTTPLDQAQTMAVAGLAQLGMRQRGTAEELLRRAMSIAPQDALIRALAQRFAGTPI